MAQKVLLYFWFGTPCCMGCLAVFDRFSFIATKPYLYFIFQQKTLFWDKSQLFRPCREENGDLPQSMDFRKTCIEKRGRVFYFETNEHYFKKPVQLFETNCTCKWPIFRKGLSQLHFVPFSLYLLNETKSRGNRWHPLSMDIYWFSRSRYVQK